MSINVFKRIESENPFHRLIKQHHEYYNTKIKTYPTGEVLIITAPYRVKHKLTAEANAELVKEINFNSNAYWNNLNFNHYDARYDKTLEFKPERDFTVKHKKDSSKRSKDKAMDYAKSNIWTHFMTFTTSPEHMKDRWDYDEFCNNMNKFLKALKRRNPEAQWIVFPERHENGAWHAHGLFNVNIQSELSDSGLKDKSGRIIYNWDKYSVGFSTVTIIGDSSKAASYVVKYMTKDNEVPKGKKRYWASKGIKKPTIQYDNVDEHILSELFEKASYSNEFTRTLRNYATGQTNDVHFRYMTFNSL